jgi:N-acetylneuraminic acid mutarotase
MWQMRTHRSARMTSWLLIGLTGLSLVACQDDRDAALSPVGPSRQGLSLASTSSAPISVFLHGSGGTANPPLLSLDGFAPTATTPKYKDSPGIKFASGNPWTAVGTWTAAPSLTSGSLSALGDVQLWLGLKNSDDIGTNFDVRVEAYENGTLFASSESYCVQGITRNPDLAKQVAVSFVPFSATAFNGTSDALSLKIQTRIGTNGTGAFCGGHSNAIGLRLYFDAVVRASGFAVTIGDFWKTKAPMPTGRNGLGVAAINGVLYAVGGFSSRGASALGTVEAYDPTTNTWTAKASMPTARGYLGVAAIGGILFAVGGGPDPGNNSGALATVEAYDPATDTWTTKAPMPTARTLLGVGAINGILYAVGGVNPAGLMTVEAYDPTTDTWTTKASFSSEREYLGVSAINGILYAVGGCPCPTSEMDAYDPATDTWTMKASMPTARQNLAVAVSTGILYAVGGYSSADLNTVEAYDPITNMWTTKASMPTARFGLGVAAIDGILYAVGGAENGHPEPALATVEAYQP